MTLPKIWIGVNDHGRRVGQSHPRAELSDHEVELMRQLHEDEGWGYRRLAKKFEVAKRTVRDICHYRYRAQPATKFKRCG